MGKLNEKEKKYLKGVSKALGILSKIGKVLLTIAIPFMVLAMLVLFVVFNKFDYRDNTIYFDNEKVVTIEKSDDGMNFYDNGKLDKIIKFDSEDKYEVLKIKDFLDNNGKEKFLWFIEIALLLGTSLVFVTRMILGKAACFFKNISENTTPFTEENTNYLKSISILMLVNIITSFVGNFILELMVNLDSEVIFGIGSIYETLIIFVMYYVFRYGTMLQERSKQNIYGDVNE